MANSISTHHSFKTFSGQPSLTWIQILCSSDFCKILASYIKCIFFHNGTDIWQMKHAENFYSQKWSQLDFHPAYELSKYQKKLKY